jgi:hypothetical protein
MIFLQDAALDALSTANPQLSSDLGAFALGAGISVFVIIAAFYVYFAAAFYSIGKKAKIGSPGVSWANPVISMWQISKMHWWPWPVIFLGMFFSVIVMTASPVVGGIIYLALIAFIIAIVLVWNWKTFKAVKRPGWWAILSPAIFALGILLIRAGFALIGLLAIFVSLVLYVVLTGIAAWSK